MNYTESLALDLLEEYAQDLTIDIADVEVSQYRNFLGGALREFCDNHGVTWVDSPNPHQVIVRSDSDSKTILIGGCQGGGNVSLFDVASKVVSWVTSSTQLKARGLL